jgi:hypothetical protein
MEGRTMTREEGRKLCDELWKMVGETPGAWTADMQRAREIRNTFASCFGVTTYFHEKLDTAFEFLGYWHRPRVYKKWGPTPDKLAHLTRLAISNLRNVVEQELPKA